MKFFFQANSAIKFKTPLHYLKIVVFFLFSKFKYFLLQSLGFLRKRLTLFFRKIEEF